MVAREDLLNELLKRLDEAEPEGADTIARDLLEKQGVKPVELVTVLSKKLKEIGEKFGKGEIFLMDLVGSAEVMNTIMEVLKPALEKSEEKPEYLGTVIIGTVEGDIHDIGQRIVASLLQAAGFKVIEIGNDQPIENFIKAAEENKADIIGASALLTTTMPMQRKLVEELRKRGLREKYKVVVGGAPTSPEWAEEIGADGHGADATEAVEIAKRLVGKG